jgi:hypothetical protein
MPEYTVQRGDTLSGIAQKSGLGTNWQALGYTGDPRKLAVGTKLSWGGAPAAAPAAGSPSPQNVTQYLNSYQDQALEALNPVKIREGIANLMTTLKPTMPEPTAINRVDIRGRLNEENGIGALEGIVNELQAEENDLISRKRGRTTAEMDKTASLNVISGRVGEVERQENERLDVILRTKGQAIDQLKTRYTIVQQIMQDTEMDYQDAVKRYDSEYNRNFEMSKFVYAQAKDKIEFGFKERDDARANLQIYYNAITEGGLNINSVSPEQRLEMNRLEAKAGLGIGFLAGVSAAQDGMKMHSVTQRVDPNGNRYADVLYVDRNGAMKIESKMLGKEYVAGLHSADARSGGATTDKAAQAREARINSFYGSLKDPKANVASSAQQENNYRANGKDYITREQLISRLATEYGDIPMTDIKAKVYSYYR